MLFISKKDNGEGQTIVQKKVKLFSSNTSASEAIGMHWFGFLVGANKKPPKGLAVFLLCERPLSGLHRLLNVQHLPANRLGNLVRLFAPDPSDVVQGLLMTSEVVQEVIEAGVGLLALGLAPLGGNREGGVGEVGGDFDEAGVHEFHKQG